MIFAGPGGQIASGIHQPDASEGEEAPSLAISSTLSTDDQEK
jgi:hypothetical protein